MVENVRVELLFHVPNMACYRYTTLSIYRLKYPKLHIVFCLVFLVTPLFQSHNLLHIWTLVRNDGLEPPVLCL